MTNSALGSAVVLCLPDLNFGSNLKCLEDALRVQDEKCFRWIRVM